MTRVFICEDSPMLRLLLRACLEDDEEIDVVGEAEDGTALVEAVRDAAADLVLLDLSMPRADGLEALAALRADAPGLGIVVLSGFDRKQMALRVLALGADSYLEKTCGMDEVRRTVHAVATSRRTARSRRA